MSEASKFTSSICNYDFPSLPSLLNLGNQALLTPYHITFFTCHAIAIISFTVSSLTGNLSQVDKLWSILPSVYAWMCVVDQRTMLMAILSTLWSVRLTYNFHRRGGYTWPKIWLGEEDYRWHFIREGTLGGHWALLTNKWFMVVFNIVFISLMQNWLLLWIASPSLVAWSTGMRSVHCTNEYPGELAGLNSIDAIASILFLMALGIEAAADNQQYNFQQRKRLRQTAEEFSRSGLFSIVRKPNYAAEQMIWISYYIFSVAASSQLWNWSCGGFISLIILFQGSGWLTEQITVRKYPAYAEYQRLVPLYIPNVVSSFSRVGCKNVDSTRLKQK